MTITLSQNLIKEDYKYVVVEFKAVAQPRLYLKVEFITNEVLSLIKYFTV